MSEEAKKNASGSDSLHELVSLNWQPFDENTVKKDELLLMKVERSNGDFDYHTGTFTENTGGGLFGVVGGHFHFDMNIKQWASIQQLIES